MGTVWFIMDFGNILFFALVSYALYGLIKYTDDESFKKFKEGLRAAWFASGFAIFGFFFIGLACLISLAMYAGLVYATEHFVAKYKKRVKA